MSQFALIPASVIRSGIDSTALHLYAALATYASTDRTVWPGQQALADDLGWSRSKVQRAMRVLLDAELVTSQRRRQSPARYTLRSITSDPRHDDLTDREASTCDAREASSGDATRQLLTNEQTNALTTSVRTPPPADRSPMPQDALFAEPQHERREQGVGHRCLVALLQAYGQPLSRSVIARLGAAFKANASQYGDEHALVAAREMGERRVVSPNAVEQFTIRVRDRHVGPQGEWAAAKQAGWQQWADDTRRDGSTARSTG